MLVVNRDTTNRRITRHEASHVAESTNIKLHQLVRLLLVTRGYHDVLDGWRALAKGASLTPDAEVVRVRVQTKEPNLKLGWLHGNETCVDRHESCGPWSKLGECKNNPTWMRPHCPVSCKVVSGCTSSKPRILVEDVSTETWTSVKAVVGDLLLALRGDEVLFVREVDGPADVTVVAS